MNNTKPIDLMAKCPVCGATAVFDRIPGNNSKINFYIHCPECGFGAKQIYSAELYLSYTGDLVPIGEEIQDAINDWNALAQNSGKTKRKQSTASRQEAAERASELRTQGRKGCKAVRINMAFTPENHKFIKTMARISGMTMTEFVNKELEKSMKQSGEYKCALEIKEKMAQFNMNI